MVESTALGGQAGSSRRIENYLGFPAGITGVELTSRADHAGAQVRREAGDAVSRDRARARRRRAPRRGARGRARGRRRAVVLATGAEYRRLPLDELSDYEGTSVFYAAGPPEAQACGASRVGRGRRRQLRRPGRGLARPRRRARHAPASPRRPPRDDVRLPDPRARALRRRHPRPQRDRGAPRQRGAPRGGHAHRRHAPRRSRSSSSSSARGRARSGSATRSRGTTTASSSPATPPEPPTCSRRACRASSPPATCARARRSAARPPSAKARWPCSSCTSISRRSSRRRFDERARLHPSRPDRGARAAREVDGCEDCLRIGGKWLHLRICLTCGHVGCCDNSPNRHATAHYHATRPTRSSARSSRARTGAGATSTTSRSLIDGISGETRIPPSPLLQ